MGNCFEQDILEHKYSNQKMLNVAHQVLSHKDQSEEEFLGAQCILLLNGLL